MNTPDFAGLLADLTAEEAALDEVVAGLDADGWATPTPAEGWNIQDSVAHLAYTEDLARCALTDADAFATRLRELRERRDAEQSDEVLVGSGRSMTGEAVLAWWREARQVVLDALEELDARTRVPWIAGPMSAMSFATARLMETWAHGHDVRDALGSGPEVSPRLRHVADLGVRTRPFAYQARDRPPPSGDVRVELLGPDGGAWTWGEDAAGDVVRGSALDFCLVVTQRAHPADTGLEIRGPAAQDWMAIAQAFAGPPTEHRPRRRT